MASAPPVTITLSREELARRGRAGVTKRWAEHRAQQPEALAVDFETLSPAERRVVRALIDAKKAGVSAQEKPAQEERSHAGDPTPTATS